MLLFVITERARHGSIRLIDISLGGTGEEPAATLPVELGAIPLAENRDY